MQRATSALVHSLRSPTLDRSLQFAETAPNHPLLVGTPDRMGLAFSDIHEIHSADSFAAAALKSLESFLESARHDVLYVFDSHPNRARFECFFSWARLRR